MTEQHRPPLTQFEIEEKISTLDQEVEELIEELRDVEKRAARAKADFEIAKAKALIQVRSDTMGRGEKMNADEKEATALTMPIVEEAFGRYLEAQAEADGYRAVARLYSTRSDLLRTLAANLRPLVTR